MKQFGLFDTILSILKCLNFCQDSLSVLASHSSFLLLFMAVLLCVASDLSGVVHLKIKLVYKLFIHFVLEVFHELVDVIRRGFCCRRCFDFARHVGFSGIWCSL